MNPGADPVPGTVRAELERLDGRWATLPFVRALPHAGEIHAFTRALAARDAAARALSAPEPGTRSGPAGGGAPVPAAALGDPDPAVVVPQLAAVLYELFDGPARPGEGGARELADALVRLRLRLDPPSGVPGR